MKTLYFRIVHTTMLIMIFSALTSFVFTNAFYHYRLKAENDQKNTIITQNVIAQFYQQKSGASLEEYLQGVAKLNYQIYVVDEEGKESFYGPPFKSQPLKSEIIRSVLEGEEYHGIAHYPFGIFVTGFFEPELTNSIGLPMEHEGKRYALFLRPDVGAQFRELRTFLAILLGLTLLLSFLFVIVSTRFIVKPITTLTEATKKISEGDYRIDLPTPQRDEIGVLTQHFKLMAQNLQQLEGMRQEFVSSVSHEIQSPLATIQGFAQALQTEKLSESERIKYLSIIETESRRLSSVSKQLLTLASLEQEAPILTISRFDVAAQLKQVLMVSEWHWREKELAITMDLPSTWIRGDQKLLHQVWSNLITNAIKFTPEGGTIALKIAPSEEKGCWIMVEDTGIGIVQEDLPYLFDPFYKVDKARQRSSEGSGLGLSVVKKIIDLHGGQVRITSQLGEGTAVTVWLPKEKE